ncbi:MAG: c-type cytochrome biogenesis protein CcmI [Rhodospirillaceae bacterium]|nr:c-type cytochrome biogenesis protein CcmI [Rhodospirillaceae bacterium]MBT4588223.1 c-type cytochrome biogenesis protein CcmI [Rhodospirillaceae bacterium]MBT7266564.1 c-type cytochrome biogenesis protein CcmI [Rhodospirillaceae bacterium]
MTLWIAIAALVLISLLVIILPLLRKEAAAQSDHNAIVYQDQLTEIDSDVERGLLNEVEAAALKSEINRRLDKTSLEKTAATPSQTSGLRLAMAIAIIVVIPLAALGLYQHLGSPQKPDLPFAKRKFAAPVKAANAEMERLVNALKARMEENPDKIEGWLLLGRSLVSLERFKDASEAFRRAFQVDPNRADIAASAGETGFMAEGGEFTPEVRRYFQTAQKLNPGEHKALYYLGLDLAEQKKYREAMQNWIDLIAISPPNAPWLEIVRQRLAAIAESEKIKISDIKPRLTAPPRPAMGPAPGPTQEDVKAAQEMSGKDRQAFIRSMVERLAERLKSEPGDLAGWRRLAQAYRVLGEEEKAAEAEARIRELTK